MAESQWDNTPVPDDETDDTVITVWNIEPHIDSSYDYCCVRSFADAIKCATKVAEYLCEDSLPTKDSPANIKIWTSKMTLGDYREIQETY
jgi:hypothetical protein